MLSSRIPLKVKPAKGIGSKKGKQQNVETDQVPKQHRLSDR